MLDAALQSKISRYFSAVMDGQKYAKIQKELPKNMPLWGKVRIAGGGDQIRVASGGNLNRGRNMSYVRVSLSIQYSNEKLPKNSYSMKWKFWILMTIPSAKFSMGGWI